MTKRRGAAVAATAVAAALAGCGGGGGGANAKRFSGEAKNIAAVMDIYQSDIRSGNTDKVCHDLFTDKLVGIVAASSGKSCADRVKAQESGKDTVVTVNAVHVTGSSATADVTEQNGNRSALYFRKQDGKWRIDGIVPAR